MDSIDQANKWQWRLLMRNEHAHAPFHPLLIKGEHGRKQQTVHRAAEDVEEMLGIQQF